MATAHSMVASDRMRVVKIIGQQDSQNCTTDISRGPVKVKAGDILTLKPHH